MDDLAEAEMDADALGYAVLCADKWRLHFNDCSHENDTRMNHLRVTWGLAQKRRRDLAELSAEPKMLENPKYERMM